MTSSALPPSMKDAHHEVLASKSTLSIAIPIVLLSLLSLALLFLLAFLRAKCKKNSSICSFRTGDIEKPNSECNRSVNPRSVVDSPDVRSCILGGKLVCTQQTRIKRGQVYTYRELEVATDGFSDGNAIGKEGNGVVYRGILSDGTAVAIKMLQRNGCQGERDFRLEVDLLSRMHSHYLVGLVGYCADQHYRLLVFEFMPGGSLKQHLHPSSQGYQYQPLDWSTRLTIALDCARGLEFLHERMDPAVIHRGLKCSNILLDHNFRAKVSDFAMAKTVSNKINSQVQTRIFGTSAYVAPEYASSGKLSTKSDVYSYGVVLLELLTGRVPIDITRPPGEHVLVSWALPRLTNNNKVLRMVDPALQGQYSIKELIQIAAIAAMCIQSEADYRPLITDVVQSLIPLIKGPSSASPITPSRIQHHIVIPVS